LPSFINSLAECLQQGVILFMDYGFPKHEYYHPERNRGSLMCHYQHQAHEDPLILLGIQDITAHVDFSTLAESALSAGLELGGFTNQASFLLNCGLTELMQAQEQEANSLLAVKQLILPSEMGELFKVMALTQFFDYPLLGFQQFDQRH